MPTVFQQMTPCPKHNRDRGGSDLEFQNKNSYLPSQPEEATLQMDWLKRFLNSTIGLKFVMAVSGVALVGFVIAHMAGNLQVFFGPKAFNHYSEFLQGEKALLWGILRPGVAIATILHIYSLVKLLGRTHRARPDKYDKKVYLGDRKSPMLMRFGGAALLLFIIFHLLHMTTGHMHISAVDTYTFQHCGYVGEDFNCTSYENLVTGLQVWWVAAIYMLAQIFLGLHLVHGVWSMFRTLGLSSPRWDVIARWAANGVAIAVAGGNILITLAILIGVVSL